MNDTLSWISDPGACKQKLKPNNYNAQENMKLFIFINILFEREVEEITNKKLRTPSYKERIWKQNKSEKLIRN